MESITTSAPSMLDHESCSNAPEESPVTPSLAAFQVESILQLDDLRDFAFCKRQIGERDNEQVGQIRKASSNHPIT